MKLYVVEYSQGQYGDFSHHIEGIFTDPVKAEGYAAKIRADIAAMRDEENPVGHGNWDIMTDDEYDSFERWQEKIRIIEGFNDAIVYEYDSDIEFDEYRREN